MESQIEPEIGLCNATIRVRESEKCAAGIVAEALSSFVPEIRLVHSDSVEAGWRQTITKIPAIVVKEDLESFAKHADCIGDYQIRKAGDDTWVIMSLRDTALNETMKVRAIFQKLVAHIATPKYEDFQIYLYPSTALDSVVKALSVYGKANLLTKEPVQFADLPIFKFDLMKSGALTENEKAILEVAVDKGWYDYPRPPDGHLEKIAAVLGISEATLSVQLRQISRKLSSDYVRRFVTPF